MIRHITTCRERYAEVRALCTSCEASNWWHDAFTYARGIKEPEQRELARQHVMRTFPKHLEQTYARQVKHINDGFERRHKIVSIKRPNVAPKTMHHRITAEQIKQAARALDVMIPNLECFELTLTSSCRKTSEHRSQLTLNTQGFCVTSVRAFTKARCHYRGYDTPMGIKSGLRIPATFKHASLVIHLDLPRDLYAFDLTDTGVTVYANDFSSKTGSRLADFEALEGFKVIPMSSLTSKSSQEADFQRELVRLTTRADGARTTPISAEEFLHRGLWLHRLDPTASVKEVCDTVMRTSSSPRDQFYRIARYATPDLFEG